jgi:hypothetical protein
MIQEEEETNPMMRNDYQSKRFMRILSPERKDAFNNNNSKRENIFNTCNYL